MQNLPRYLLHVTAVFMFSPGNKYQGIFKFSSSSSPYSLSFHLPPLQNSLLHRITLYRPLSITSYARRQASVLTYSGLGELADWISHPLLSPPTYKRHTNTVCHELISLKMPGNGITPLFGRHLL